MTPVLFAIILIAAFFGGGVFYLSSRQGADAWLAFTLGLLIYGVFIVLGPTLCN